MSDTITVKFNKILRNRADAPGFNDPQHQQTIGGVKMKKDGKQTVVRTGYVEGLLAAGELIQVGESKSESPKSEKVEVEFIQEYQHDALRKKPYKVGDKTKLDAEVAEQLASDGMVTVIS